MNDVFHLIDLESQVLAVKKQLKGKSESEKLKWLSCHGEIELVPKYSEGSKQPYRFTSHFGNEIIFFFDEDEIVFFGPHNVYTLSE